MNLASMPRTARRRTAGSGRHLDRTTCEPAVTQSWRCSSLRGATILPEHAHRRGRNVTDH